MGEWLLSQTLGVQCCSVFCRKNLKGSIIWVPFPIPPKTFSLTNLVLKYVQFFFIILLMDPHSPTLLLSITHLLDLSAWSFFCFGPCWFLILFAVHLRLYTHRTLIIHVFIWTPVACEQYLKYFSDFFPLGLRIKFYSGILIWPKIGYLYMNKIKWSVINLYTLSLLTRYFIYVDFIDFIMINRQQSYWYYSF